MFAMRPPVATKDFVAQAAAGLQELGVVSGWAWIVSIWKQSRD